MRALVLSIVALSFLAPSTSVAINLNDGFLDSGSLIISQKLKPQAQQFAPLHGFFETEVYKIEPKPAFSEAGSIVVGGTISKVNSNSSKAPLLGFFQNDILAEADAGIVFENSSDYSDSGSFSITGSL